MGGCGIFDFDLDRTGPVTYIIWSSFELTTGRGRGLLSSNEASEVLSASAPSTTTAPEELSVPSGTELF